MQAKNIELFYELAKERYARLGVHTDQALDQLRRISISIHCWQGDDVYGAAAPGGIDRHIGLIVPIGRIGPMPIHLPPALQFREPV